MKKNRNRKAQQRNNKNKKTTKQDRINIQYNKTKNTIKLILIKLHYQWPHRPPNQGASTWNETPTHTSQWHAK